MVLAALYAPPDTMAQRLPVRAFDSRDGLAGSPVWQLWQDREGYLWLGGVGGVSRFDGARFVNFGRAEGLPGAHATAFAEDTRGRIWIGTWGDGLLRLIESPESASADGRRCVRYHIDSDPHNDVIFDLRCAGADTLWCISRYGLYRALEREGDSLHFEALITSRRVENGFFDRQGTAWIADSAGLHEYAAGVRRRHAWPPGFPNPHDLMLADDNCGRLILNAGQRYFLFDKDGPAGGTAVRWHAADSFSGPAGNAISFLGESDGTAWIGSARGLYRRSASGQVVGITLGQGLKDEFILSILRTRDGTLWVATNTRGVCRIESERVLSYTSSEGMPVNNVWDVLDDTEGRIHAVAAGAGMVRIEEDRIVRIPGTESPPFRDTRPVVRDPRGDWWLTEGGRVHRFRGPQLVLNRPTVYAPGGAAGADEPAASLERMGYDPVGGWIWASTFAGDFYRWTPTQDAPAFRSLSLKSMGASLLVLAAAADRSGGLWLCSWAGLWRVAGSRIEPVTAGAGLPDTRVRALFVDSRGWLWVGLLYDGVSMTREPGAADPHWTHFGAGTRRTGESIRSIAEDQAGRVYFGSNRGLDWYDPARDEWGRFGYADGLPGEVVNRVFVTRDGRLWLATSGGFCRLDTGATPPEPPPPVHLTRVEAGGRSIPFRERGAVRVGPVRLNQIQQPLRFEFTAVDLRGGDRRDFQHRLTGIDREWSRPGTERSVVFERLPPGRYEFEVRALTPTGQPETKSAAFAFELLPPLWRRGWFLALAAGLLSLAVWSALAARLRHLRELDRVRRAIALDLHDDLGSGLTQVAILGEVLKRSAAGADAGRLDQVARLSRAMRDSLSDIVWAVDPAGDALDDLVPRMRQAANNLFEGRGIDLKFTAPDVRPHAKLRLPADRRREVLLLFKEAMNNAARHADAASVSIEVSFEPNALVILVEDDGKGFEPAGVRAGHGIPGMHRRARQMGAKLEIESGPAGGTRVRLETPYGAGRRVPGARQTT